MSKKSRKQKHWSPFGNLEIRFNSNAAQQDIDRLDRKVKGLGLSLKGAIKPSFESAEEIEQFQKDMVDIYKKNIAQ